MPRCWRSQLLAGPRVQVKLLSDYQRWFRLSDIAWLFIILASCWISGAGREGGSCVPVWGAKLWFLLSVPGMRLCRQLDRSFPSAESGFLEFAENNVSTALFSALGRSGFIFQGRQEGFPAGRMFHCCPVLLVSWGQWVSPVMSKGPLVGLQAGDMLLFAPSAPLLEIWWRKCLWERVFNLLQCSNGLLRSSSTREYECNFLLHDLAEDQKCASVNRNIVDWNGMTVDAILQRYLAVLVAQIYLFLLT